MYSLNKKDIDQLDRHYRVNLIHSLAGFHSPFLIVTKDLHDNLALFSSIIHLGSDPPLLGIKFRPIGQESHTIRNLSKTRKATLNLVSKSIYRQAHLTSARLPQGQSEFDLAGLNRFYDGEWELPYVSESPIKMAVKLEEIVPVKTNNTQLAVVSIQKIIFDKKWQETSGFIDLENAEVMAVQGLYRYYTTQFMNKLSYVSRSSSSSAK